jgi:hypothetical protein
MRIIVPQAIAVALLAVALVHGRLSAPIPRTAVVAVDQNDDASSAVPALGADAIKGDRDKAGQLLETAGAQLKEPAPDRDEPGHKHDRGPNEASKSSAGASAANSGDAQIIAGRELAVGLPTNDANLYRERGIAWYRSGDLVRAIVELDEAIRARSA